MLNHTLKVFDYNINLIASTPRWQKSVEKNIRSYFVLLKTFIDRYQDISPAVEYSASFWCFQNNYGQCCKVFFFRVPFCSPSPLKTSLTKSNIWKKKILRSEVSASLAQCSISMPLKKLYMVGVQLSQGSEPLRRDSLLFTTKSPVIPVTHLINLVRMKGWVDLVAIQWFWARDAWIGNLALFWRFSNVFRGNRNETLG